MLKNATYNLMETATVISKGLYRYDTFKKDAQGCQHCQQIWEQMQRSDEESLSQVVPHIHEHLKQDEGSRRAA
jgi:hypothetical protein